MGTSKRVVCSKCRIRVTRSTSGECRECLLQPAEAPPECLPESQRGAWTEAGRERREREFARRRQQFKPENIAMPTKRGLLSVSVNDNGNGYTVTHVLSGLPVASLHLSHGRASALRTALYKLDIDWSKIYWTVEHKQLVRDTCDTYRNGMPPRVRLAPLSLDATAEIETALDVDADAEVRAWYDAIPTMGNGHKWIFTFDELTESAKATARADYLSIRALTPAPEADPDAEVKAFRLAHHQYLPLEWCDILESTREYWRTKYAAHKARESSTPTLPQPEPANVAPAPTSQAADTLAVTEYREPEQERGTYTAAEMVTMLVFGLAMGAIGLWTMIHNGMVTP